jgi:hypothetical protein
MDTNIFDYEISVTNMNKSYIELSASRIHRNMIRKLRNLDSKSVHLLILAVSIVTIIFAASQQQQQVNARTSGYEQGQSDAKAGFFDDTCPPSLPDLSCGLYKADYVAGHAAWNGLHGGDTGRFSGGDNDGQNTPENDDDDDN